MTSLRACFTQHASLATNASKRFLSISEVPDRCDEILAAAHVEERVVITFDNDYGTLIFRDDKKHAGVLRLAAMDPDAQVAVCMRVIAEAAADLERGAIVVANRVSIRIRLP